MMASISPNDKLSQDEHREVCYKDLVIIVYSFLSSNANKATNESEDEGLEHEDQDKVFDISFLSFKRHWKNIEAHSILRAMLLQNEPRQAIQILFSCILSLLNLPIIMKSTIQSNQRLSLVGLQIIISDCDGSTIQVIWNIIVIYVLYIIHGGQQYCGSSHVYPIHISIERMLELKMAVESIKLLGSISEDVEYIYNHSLHEKIFAVEVSECPYPSTSTATDHYKHLVGLCEAALASPSQSTSIEPVVSSSQALYDEAKVLAVIPFPLSRHVKALSQVHSFDVILATYSYWTGYINTEQAFVLKAHLTKGFRTQEISWPSPEQNIPVDADPVETIEGQGMSSSQFDIKAYHDRVSDAKQKGVMKRSLQLDKNRIRFQKMLGQLFETKSTSTIQNTASYLMRPVQYDNLHAMSDDDQGDSSDEEKELNLSKEQDPSNALDIFGLLKQLESQTNEVLNITDDSDRNVIALDSRYDASKESFDGDIPHNPSYLPATQQRGDHVIVRLILTINR